MKHPDTDTFWYHVCSETNRMTYIPVGQACPDCNWSTKDRDEKKKRQDEYNEYLDELQKGDLL